MARRINDFQTIHSEGGLLPSDLLRRVMDPKEALPGIRPEDYGLPQTERINEVVTQSWNRLRKHWTEFRSATANTAADDPATGVTNDKWTLPLLRELGFGLLPISAGPEIGGRIYAINRFVGPAPVHLVGRGVSLDRRAAGVRGAAAVNPHGLVQEFLNRSPSHVWGIVSNGLRLRVLRDNQALSRQSYIEFDLEAMFAGEVYSDFVLLWLTVHATRFAPRDGVRPEDCWLEEWTRLADEQGTRVLGELRAGVEKALEALGEGFTGHSKNTALREALRTGQLQLADFHGQMLRVVYRLIFLFVAEDRTLDGQPILHSRDDSEPGRTARARFSAYYSTTRLRDLASTIKGSRHGDLWRQFQLLVGALSGDQAFSSVRDALALPVLGSLLWDPASTAALNVAELTNYDLLEVLRHLAFTRQGKVLRPVDYRNLGAEELGGVYESLLALTPQISADGARFAFAEFAGNERKTSGSYYTPDSLVQCLLDSALDPVVNQAIKGKTGPEAEQAILALKICDPAVGSGHFLVGAAHRLARHLARVRALAAGESEASPLLYQHALRDVIGRCLYGVDLNPMAAELCRVSLWLEALDPGKPLSFLDHHIRVGNSLFGATPDLMAAGLPDDAFAEIEGDDNEACTVLKKRNKAERRGLGPLFSEQEAGTQARLQQMAAALEELRDDLPEDIHTKELALQRREQTEEYRHKKRLADAWCAAYVVRKFFREPGRDTSANGITQGNLNDLASGRDLPADTRADIEHLSGQYGFFHWHLAFPEAFAGGGFDAVLGNPPWESSEFKEKEWFADHSPHLAAARTGAIRKELIANLETEDPNLFQAYLSAKRLTDGVGHFLRHSELFPLTGVGKVNTFAVFAELFTRVQRASGRSGCVMPSGIAFNDTTKFFFQKVVGEQMLVSLFDFENRKLLFPDIDSRVKFCLLTLTGRRDGAVVGTEFVFFAQDVSDTLDQTRRVRLSSADIALLNPNTLTCPIFRSRSDAEITLAIYRRLPIVMREVGPGGNDWDLATKPGLFNMTHDSNLFLAPGDLQAAEDSASQVRRRGADEYLPLYEAKMFELFDHRAAGVMISQTATIRMGQPEAFDEHAHMSPSTYPAPRFWVPRAEVDRRLEGQWSRDWLFGWKHVGSPTNERTLVPFLSPRYGIGDSLYVAVSGRYGGIDAASKVACFVAGLSSLVADFVARQKMGGINLTPFIFKQLPVLPPSLFDAPSRWSPSESNLEWMRPRVIELVYSAWDLLSLAHDCGWSGPPFRWNQERRLLLRCELDAAFFHLYLPAEVDGGWRPVETEVAEDLERTKVSFPTPRAAVAYIMDTFPIIQRKDEENYGDYRTKLQILDAYDRMQRAIAGETRYETLLDPPPADPRVAHDESTRPHKAVADA